LFEGRKNIASGCCRTGGGIGVARSRARVGLAVRSTGTVLLAAEFSNEFARDTPGDPQEDGVETPSVIAV